jgi:hypothetical protein
MRTPFGRAAEFFDRAYSDQSQAAEMQEYADSRNDSPSTYNLRLDNPTIGAVPPDLVGNPAEQAEMDNYVRGMKDELIETAKEKRRPTNGEVAYRPTGGVNTAVKR